MNIKPGFYPVFSSHDYHADPCESPSLNYSTAKTIVQQSDWHAWKQHPRLGGDPFTSQPKMDIGSIDHCLLLRQPVENVEVIDAKDYRKKEVQEARDNAKEAGKLVILKRQLDELYLALAPMRENLKKANVDLSGYCESTIIWERDCLCRTRLDHVSRDFCTIVDIKCTEDANPQNIERHIVEMGYDIQAAAEIEAIETIHPELEGRVKFDDVFIEMKPPYFVVVAHHSEGLLDLGRRRWGRAKRRWIECLRTDTWEGYVNEMIAHAPNYAVNREFGEVA